MAKRLVPIQPFSEFLQDQIEKKFGNANALGLEIGCSSGRVKEYIDMKSRDGRNNSWIPRKTIDFEVVDKISAKLGYHPALIYDDYLEWEPIDD